MYGVIDVGTTGIKLSLYDRELRRLHYERVELGFVKVNGGRYVEQDSRRLYEVVRGLAKKAKSLGARMLGIATYRTSLVAWKRDGTPLTNVVTWVDRRGVEVVRKLPPHLKLLRLLPLFRAVFSPESPAIIARWMFDHVEGLRGAVERGDAMLWTIDSYLIYRLTGRYASDATNAALTGLIDPRDFSPLSTVAELLDIPLVPPEIVDNNEVLGDAEGVSLSAVIGDQQAAAVAEACLSPGAIKATHGTGTFVIAGSRGFAMVGSGLVPVVVARLDGRAYYGVEGFIRTTGAVLDWLVRIGILPRVEEADAMASKGSPGVFFLPSFSGLRTPPAPDMRGVVASLALSTTSEDIVRGFVEGVALLTAYIVRLLSDAVGGLKEPLRCDGGMSKCGTLLQLIADYTGMRVVRHADTEATSRGVAVLLAIADGALGVGDIEGTLRFDAVYEPRLAASEREERLAKFESTLRRVVKWRL